MKKFLFVASMALCASTALFAAGPNNPANFEIAKTKMSEMADKRITIIKEFKDCVQAAKDNAALKECRKNETSAMRAIKPPKGPKAPPPPPPAE